MPTITERNLIEALDRVRVERDEARAELAALRETHGALKRLAVQRLELLKGAVKRAERLEAEREDYARMRVKQYGIEASGPNLAEADARVALLEGLLRDLAAKGEAMKAAFFTGDDNREAIACMEWDDAAAAALADGGREDCR